ncbi:unnamed protein product [Meganyctiphanes norvegica]|uniref:C2H2-type domain-containing protein n=1 Tax=Meganyctiphanes norvegica TaxID=48144 RepID=A0AAV2S6A7_MEGNR
MSVQRTRRKQKAPARYESFEVEMPNSMCGEYATPMEAYGGPGGEGTSSRAKNYKWDNEFLYKNHYPIFVKPKDKDVSNDTSSSSTEKDQEQNASIRNSGDVRSNDGKVVTSFSSANGQIDGQMVLKNGEFRISEEIVTIERENTTKPSDNIHLKNAENAVNVASATKLSDQLLVSYREVLPADVKPYQCSYCEKCFSQIHDLIVHHRTHTGESRLYKCSHCDMCYAQIDELVTHQRTHLLPIIHLS